MSTAQICIITPSYRNDFDLAKDLCASLDRFCQFEFEHILLVPRSDYALFASLGGSNRKVLLRENILEPYGIRRLPIPTIMHIPFYKTIKIREQYYSRKAGRISGWLVQQIVKLSAAQFTGANILIFADSDVQLVRPWLSARLFDGDKINLQQHLRGIENDTHKLWRATAHRLLGITAPPKEHYNYIAQLVPWRRDILMRLLQRIEAVNKEKWPTVIARAKAVSEYILFGEYIINDPKELSTVNPTDMHLTNSVWLPRAEIDEQAILATMKSENIAIHVQSTGSIPIERRRASIRNICLQLEDAR